MKTLEIILLGNLFLLNCLFCQSNRSILKLVKFEENSFVVPNDYKCDTCALSVDLKSDISIIKIMAPGYCGTSIGDADMNMDTLKLISGTKPDKIDTSIILNCRTKKSDTILIALYKTKFGPSHCMNVLTYTLAGLDEKRPSFIKYNGILLKECKLRNETFVIKNNDTINYTDRFGLKQGTWIDYYTDGKIKRQDVYTNGFINRGYEFNSKGDTIVIRSNSEGNAIEMHFNK
jgi:hypothetical protein